MSPITALAAQLRDLAARAVEHSNPVAVAHVLSEALGAIAGAIERAQSHADAVLASFDQLPLTPGDRAALERAGVVAVDMAARVAAGDMPAPFGDQAATPAVTDLDAHLVERAQRLHAAFAGAVPATYQVPAWGALPAELQAGWLAAARVA